MLKKSPHLLKKFVARISPQEAPDEGDAVNGNRLQRRRNSSPVTLRHIEVRGSSLGFDMDDEQIENHPDGENNPKPRRPHPNRLSVEHDTISASAEDLTAQSGTQSNSNRIGEWCLQKHRAIMSRRPSASTEGLSSPTKGSGTRLSLETMPAMKDTREYELKATMSAMHDVGQLQVTLVCASGLHAADFGGKSDPFAVVELNNVSYETATQNKTLEPRWDETFVFNVQDITDILYITVYDRDILGDPEFLGRVAVPLLRIDPDGSDQSYALKSKRFEKRAKGVHPAIVIRCSLNWNPARAAVKTIKPQEKTTPEPFKRRVFSENVNRMKKIFGVLSRLNTYLQSCFSWEKPRRSLRAFLIFQFVVFFFEPFMAPLFAMAVFFAYPILANNLDEDDAFSDPFVEDQDGELEDEDDEDKTVGERLKAVQDAAAYVQNGIGMFASTAERINNLTSFLVPFMSWIAVAVLTAAALVLYLIPIRYLIMAWGCRKFSKKLINPNHVPSSELLNFLSRVPDEVTVRKCKQLSIKDPVLVAKEDERRTSRKGRAGGGTDSESGGITIVKRVSTFFEKSRTNSPATALTRSSAIRERNPEGFKKGEKFE